MFSVISKIIPSLYYLELKLGNVTNRRTLISHEASDTG
jgi:hypothetical protein